MRKGNIFFLFLIGIIAVFMTLSACNTTSAVDYAKKGDEYLHNGDFDKAIEYYNKAIDKGGLATKDLSFVHHERGFAYSAKRQYEAAIEDFNKAIEIEPTYYNAYDSRGIAFAAKKQYDRSLEDFNKAIDLNPDFKLPYFNKACIYAEKNDISAACECLKMAIEKGYNNWSNIKTDSSLDNIRKSACFTEIMAGR